MVVTAKQKALDVLNLTGVAPIEVVKGIQSVTEPALLADLIASYLISKPEEKQEILALFDIQDRFNKVLEMLNYRIEVLKLSNQINEQTQESMNVRQREFMLREQMKAIQKELGEGRTKITPRLRKSPSHPRCQNARGCGKAGSKGTKPFKANAGRQRRIFHVTHLS